MNSFVFNLKSYVARNVGLAFFLAWNYIALYGCAMAIGVFVRYNLEYIWIYAGLSEMVCALVGLVLARKGFVCNKRIWGAVGAACAIAGNATLWIGYAIIELYWTTFAFAGILMGAGIVIMGAVWGVRLASCNSSKIEFDVMASFALAFALYCVTLPIKLYGVVNVIVASVLVVLSMYFAFRTSRSTSGDENSGALPPSLAREPQDIREEMRRSASTLVMVAMLWVLIAYFRVILSPVGSYDRFQHYFFPFLAAFIVTIGLFLVFVKSARHMSITLAFRWALPFMLLALGVVCLDASNLDNYVVAYSMNYIGMFGVQISCWIAMSKYLHRAKPSSYLTVVFGFLASQGFGILVGCGLGLIAAMGLDGIMRFALSLAVLSAGVFVVMLMGFNPHWRLDAQRHKAVHDYGASGEGRTWSGAVGETARDGDDFEASVGSQNDYLTLALHRKAVIIQQQYSLTERETEILELLLAGRTRPYIRDELVISLNTVHSHVSNIFAKCQVHSQQDLIDLAYQDMQDEQGGGAGRGMSSVSC